MKTLSKITVGIPVLVFVLGAADPVTHNHGDRSHSHTLPSDGVTHTHGNLPVGKLSTSQQATTNFPQDTRLQSPQVNSQTNNSFIDENGNTFTGNSGDVDNAIGDYNSDNLFERALEQYEISKFQEAVTLFQNTLLVRKELYGPAHPKVAPVYYMLGKSYTKLGLFPVALKYLQAALSIQKASLQPLHPEIAMTHNAIGFAYFQMGEGQKGMDSFLQVLTIDRQTLPHNHPDLATSYNNIGAAYKSMGNLPKALEYFQRSLSIYAIASPPADPQRVINTQNNIRSTRNALNESNQDISAKGSS